MSIRTEICSENEDFLESRITSTLQDLQTSVEGDSVKMAKFKKLLEEQLKKLAINDVGQMNLEKRHSVDATIMSKSLRHLKQLRAHYESGLMKTVLENIYTLLADNNQAVNVRNISWDIMNYNDCLRLFRQYKNGNKDTDSFKQEVTLYLHMLLLCHSEVKHLGANSG